MNKRLISGLFFRVSVVAFLLVSNGLHAITPSEIAETRNHALAHLFLNQDADGYWDGAEDSNIQTTANVLRAFERTGINEGLHLTSGLSWLQNAHSSNNYALGSQAGTLGLYGFDVSDELDRLAQNVNNRDPVWGTYPGFQPSLPDTAVALDAWYLSNSNYSNSAAAITFLRSSSQNSDGGWPYHAKTLVGAVSGISKVIPTSLSLIAQSHYIALGHGSQTDITEGVNWLLAQQLADGGFSDDGTATSGEIYETALVVRALNEASASGNSAASSASSAIDSAIDFLYDNSILFSSWMINDFTATAAIIEALPAVAMIDGDSDGIPNTVEAELGTDALVSDAHTLSSGLGDAVAGVNVGGAINVPAEVGTEMIAYIPLGSGSPTSYSIGGGLPLGLVFDSDDGTITGIPEEGGTFHIAFERHYANGDSDHGILTLSIDGGIAVPIMPVIFFIALVILLTFIQRYRLNVKLSLVTFTGLAMLSLSVSQDLFAEPVRLPDQTVRAITDTVVGVPAKRNETVRSINEHVNAISVALDENNSVEARKMFAFAHRTALEALNRRLNEELAGKQRSYAVESDGTIALTTEQIEQKDRALNDFYVDVDNLLSLEGNDALEAFLSIRKQLDRAEGIRYSKHPVPTWQQGGDPGEPIEIPASERTPGYVKANSREWAERVYAFNGDTLLLAQAPDTPTQAQSCSYTSADLADDGLDVQLTPEIHEKAEALDYSPIQIYEFVANEITFEPYYGALKGAHATLLSEAGGSTDQASLLIALLRASNIPARYVRGDIEADIGSSSEVESRVAKWLQAESLLVAGNRLARYGNPSAAYAPNSFLRFAHVWVEACVPYAHYQGAAIDQAGNRWVPLDPSYEVRRYTKALTTSETFDFDAYLDGYKTLMPEEQLESQVNAAITDPDMDVNDVGYRSAKVPLEIEILPASLPYHVRQFTDWSNSGSPETSTLPDSHRYMLTVETKNNAGNSLGASVTVPMHEVVLDRMTLHYKGASTSHENTMQNWRLNGGSLPTNLNLVPVIRINGVDRAVGDVSVNSATTNNRLDTRVTMQEYRSSAGNKSNCPSVSGTKLVNDACFDTIRAANYHSVQAWAFTGTPKVLASIAQDVIQAVSSNPNVANDIDNTLGTFLHYMSLGYMADISHAAKRIGVLTGNTGDVGIHLGITGSQSAVDKVLDLPFGVLKTGFYVDVPAGLSLSQNSVDGTVELDAFVATGYAASAYESFIWQEYARLDAVSTIRGIQYAEENGFEVLTINSANQSTEKPKLIAVDNGNSGAAAYPAGFITNVIENQYLDNDFEIKIPDRRINYQGWEGYTLVGVRSSGGSLSASFPIAGDYAGGYTVSDPVGWLYDPVYDTGYSGGNSSSILNGGDVVGAGTSTTNNFNPAVYQTDYGDGQGGGINLNTTSAGDPVNVVNGNFFHAETDISIPHRDLPFVFERFYNSREAMDGPLGYGWTHSFNHRLVFVDEVPDNEETSADSDGTTSSVVWANGTGGEKRIEVSGALAGGLTASASFTYRDGQYFTITRESNSSFTLTEKNGLIYRFESTAGDVNNIAKLTEIESRNGNTLTLSYNGSALDRVTDSTGRFLDFTYSNGRISRVEDWTGRAHEYEYDGNGNLTIYKNPLVLAGEQNPVVYDYFTAADSPTIDHAIKSITMPKGNGMDFEYYIDGRVFRHTNTAGETFTFQYNDFRRETVVTDSRGFTKQYFFNEHGNTERIVNEEGGIAIYEYTNASNPYLRTAVVNEARLRTEYEYNNQGTLILQRNPSGSTVEYSHFTAFQQPGKIKDANGNYRLVKYDADGNVSDEITLKAGIGASTNPATYVPQQSDLLSWVKHTYDSVGNLASSTQVRDVSSVEGFKQRWTYDNDDLYAIEIQRCGDKDGDGVINGNDPCDTAPLEHDSLGRLLTGVNARFEPTEYRYDSLNRIVRGTDVVGEIRDYGYDDNGNRDSEKLYGKLLGNNFNGIGIDQDLGISSNNSVYDSSSSHYDESDRMRVSIDSGGNATYYSYDAMGNIELVTNPDNYSIGFEYDGLGRVVSAFDEEGREAKRDIDPIGRMRSLTDPNGNAETFSYYDAANDGRLEKQCEAPETSTASPRCTTFNYDNNGNVTSIIDNAGNSTLTFYDALNRPVRIAEPVYTDPVHGQVRPVTRYSYDLLGNTKQVEAGYTDVLGMASNDVLETQQTTVFDDWGRALTITDPLGETWEYTYNKSGDLLTETIPYITITVELGSDDLTPKTINRQYLYGGLLSQEGGISYQYNPLGQLKNVSGRALVTDDDSHHSSFSNNYVYSYDDANRLSAVSGGGVTYNYVTSPGGLLESVEVRRGGQTDVINYRYDKTGRLQAISYNDSEQVIYGFDDGGRLRSKQYPGGISATYDYFDDNRLKQLLVSGTTALLQQDFTYDNLGRRDTLAENLNGTVSNSSYGYDALSRLTSEAIGSQTQSFTYDQFGNRITHNKFDGTTDFYEYDAAQQLKTVRDTNSSGTVKARYQYMPSGALYRSCEGDSAANVTSDAMIRGECDLRDYLFTRANPFGHVDQIGAYDEPGTAPVTHEVFQESTNSDEFPNLSQTLHTLRYDYRGRRMEHSGRDIQGLERIDPEGDGTYTFTWTNGLQGDLNPFDTQYRYLGEAIYLSYNSGQSAGSPEARWLQGARIDEPLILYGNDGSKTSYHQDARNSAVLTTNSQSGTVVASQQFDAFGEVNQNNGVIPQYGYTGREPSAEGFIYYRARYYDPSKGRFIQRDPKGFIDGINRYTYALNNPIGRNDPFGTVSQSTNNFFDVARGYFSEGVVRAGGALQALGGAAEIGLGALAATGGTATGIGAVPGIALGGAAIVHGADNVQAGLRTLFSGTATPTLTQQGLEAAGLSSGQAQAADAIIGLGLSLGSGALVQSARNAAAVNNAHPTFIPGPFAGDSIPASSTSQRFNSQIRSEIDEIGYRTGCHTCGTTTPGTRTGHFVPDHQPVTSLNTTNAPQRLYPQCINCSREQGLAAARELRNQ